jgi:UDP-N-acetylmuramate dehydrogenase
MSVVISSYVSLADKNWFKTGGPARFYCEPHSIHEFQEALQWASLNAVHDIFILGEGANILVSDDGFQGLVIKPRILHKEIISIENNYGYVRAGAGVSFSDFIDFCLNNNLSGLEEFSGIPGTVGGSVFINIHFFEFLLDQFFVEGTILERDTGRAITTDKQWFNFGYNSSTLHAHTYFLADAVFKLKRITELEAAYARGRRAEIIRYRQWRYPRERTCGSFFRNLYAHEATRESNGKKITHIAYYFDKLGMKGELSMGGALVSPLHANMIVSTPQASSSDIIKLARTMQERAREAFNITPQPECRLIGFTEYPLL